MKKKVTSSEDYSPSISCSMSHSEGYNEYPDKIQWLFEPVYLTRFKVICFFIILLCLIYGQSIVNFIGRIEVTLK